MGLNKGFMPRSVFAEWKPLIWYTKGEKPTNILDTMFDHIESSPPDKSLHEWAQSQEEAEHIIRYLTVENQISGSDDGIWNHRDCCFKTK